MRLYFTVKYSTCIFKITYYYFYEAISMSKLSFAYDQNTLQQKANYILKLAKDSGASDAHLEINEAIVTGVEVLKGKIDNFESSYDSALTLTLYVGKQKGSVAISSLNDEQIIQAIAKAMDICKYTKADPFSGLAEKEFLAVKDTRELSLYNPRDITSQEIVDYTLNLEAQLNKQNISDTINSDGASFSYANYNFVVANSNGFNLGYQTTRYAASISLISAIDGNMQQDYWYSSARAFEDILPQDVLVTTALKRLTRRLNSASITPGAHRVIFEASIASSLIGNFIAAISGNNLYRRLSFLNDSLNKLVFPEWLNIIEDPFIVKALASCYFDHEGVRVCKRNLVEDGKVMGYLLNSYTSRKLNMPTTGNSGGHHNILVSHNIQGELEDLCKILTNGLVIIETIGHGVNMVTGDYSVGASALVVENGVVQGFVNGLTISGNLAEIYKNIEYISNDKVQGSISCGSMLVKEINVAL